MKKIIAIIALSTVFSPVMAESYSDKLSAFQKEICLEQKTAYEQKVAEAEAKLAKAVANGSYSEKLEAYQELYALKQ